MREHGFGCFLCLFLLLQTQAQAETLSITDVFPSGEEVPVGQQVLIHFSHPVAPLSDADNDPGRYIHIEPALDCQWAWISARKLSCYLPSGERLRGATRYRVKVDSVFVGLQGETMLGPYEVAFSTVKPVVAIEDNSLLFRLEPHLQPQYRLSANLPVDKDSLRKRLRFHLADGNKIAVELERKTLSLENAQNYKIKDLWLVEPAQAIPAETRFKLVVEPGVRSTEGPLPGGQNEVIMDGDVVPAFEYQGFTCESKSGELVEVSSNQLGAAKKLPVCMADRRVTIKFSRLIREEDLYHSNVSLMIDGNKIPVKDYIFHLVNSTSMLDGVAFGDRAGREASSHSFYHKPFPPGAVVEIKLTGVTDQWGNGLNEEVVVRFKAGNLSPNWAVPEGDILFPLNDIEPVPVAALNLDQMDQTIQSLSSSILKYGPERVLENFRFEQTSVGDVLRINNQWQRYLLSVPWTQQSGIHSVEFSSKSFRNPRINANINITVSPYNVQYVNVGAHSHLWVTALETSQPVANAELRVFVGYSDDLTRLKPQPEAAALKLQTDENGYVAIPAWTLRRDRRDDGAWQSMYLGIQGEQGMSLVPLRAILVRRGESAEVTDTFDRWRYTCVGITDKALYRKGDTIHYSLIMRKRIANRLHPYRGDSVLVWGYSYDKESIKQNIHWNRFGTASGHIKVSELGKRDQPGVYAKIDGGKVDCELPLEITDYWKRGIQVGNVQASIKGNTVSISGEVKTLTDLPLPNIAVQANYQLIGLDLANELSEYSDYHFSPHDSGYSGYPVEIWEREPLGQTDTLGRISGQVVLPDGKIPYGELRINLEALAPNGEIVSSNTQKLEYQSATRFVGVRLADKEEFGALVVVVDKQGKALEGVNVQVGVHDLSNQKAYLVKPKVHCTVTSSVEPVLCPLPKPFFAHYSVMAHIRDDQGSEVRASYKDYEHIWKRNRGSGDKQTENLHLRLPDKPARLGETYTVNVVNTGVETMGRIVWGRHFLVGERSVLLRSGPNKVELPVSIDMVPKFGVAVLAQTPLANRLQIPSDRNQRFAETIGATIEVESDIYTLPFTVALDKNNYRPGDKVVMTITPELLGVDQQFSVSVLNDEVYQLLPSDPDWGYLNHAKRWLFPFPNYISLNAWQLAEYLPEYPNPWSRVAPELPLDGYPVNRVEVIGSRFGFPVYTGLDGAHQNVRSRFKEVAYWKPELVSEGGEPVTQQFTLPDNLTRWQVMVTGVDKSNRYGFKRQSLTVTKPLQVDVYPPPYASLGDRAGARVEAHLRDNPQSSVSNIPITIAARAVQGGKTLSESTVTDTADSPVASLNVQAAVNQESSIYWQAYAQAGDHQDAVELQTPLKRYGRESGQSFYGQTPSGKAVYPVRLSGGATDEYELTVHFSNSLLNGIGTPLRYMRDNQHHNLEQQLSRSWAALINKQIPRALQINWPHQDTDVTALFAALSDFRAADGGMVYYLNGTGQSDEYLSAYTLMLLQWVQQFDAAILGRSNSSWERWIQRSLVDYFSDRVSDGKPRAESVPNADILSLALVALPNKAQTLQQRIWDILGEQQDYNLFTLANMLLSGLSPDQEMLWQTVKERALWTNGRIRFDSGHRWRDGGLMGSAVALCRVLEAAVVDMDRFAGRTLFDDVFIDELARSVMHRLNGVGHWGNTHANAFCLRAVTQYHQWLVNADDDVTDDMAMQVRINMNGSPILDEMVGGAHETLTMSLPIDSNPQELDHQTFEVVVDNHARRAYYNMDLRWEETRPPEAPRFHGLEVARRYFVYRNKDWVALTADTPVMLGETVKVELRLNSPAGVPFVAVSDYLPGGLMALQASGANALTDRRILIERRRGLIANYRAGFYHWRVSDGEVTAYTKYLPPGQHKLVYFARPTAAGTYRAFPPEAEALYDTSVYGQGVEDRVRIRRAP